MENLPFPLLEHIADYCGYPAFYLRLASTEAWVREEEFLPDLCAGFFRLLAARCTHPPHRERVHVVELQLPWLWAVYGGYCVSEAPEGFLQLRSGAGRALLFSPRTWLTPDEQRAMAGCVAELQTGLAATDRLAYPAVCQEYTCPTTPVCCPVCPVPPPPDAPRVTLHVERRRPWLLRAR